LRDQRQAGLERRASREAVILGAAMSQVNQLMGLADG
jgi:hypothetical protein